MRIKRDEDGAALVEYILLVALIAMVCFVAAQLLGQHTSANITSVSDFVSSLH